MQRRLHFFSLLVVALLFTACGEEFSERMKEKSSAFGPLSQLNVIADEAVWTEMQDTLNYYFEAPYPLMPQPEPTFDVRHFTPSDLVAKNARKHLRTYLLLATTRDTTSATYQIIKRDVTSFEEGLDERGYKIKIAQDKWATNQILVYVYGQSYDKITQAIAQNHERIISEIRNFEKDALAKQVYIGGEDYEIMRKVKDSLGIALQLPKAIQAAKLNDSIAWLRMETQKASSNILLTKVPYQAEEQLYKQGMIDIRNEITAQYIEGPTPEAKMVVNQDDLPVFYNRVKLGEYDAYEIRGVWEMENAFMGGPFITYLVLGPNLESLYFIDLFVYAPGEDKRELMRHLEYIATTIGVLP